MVVFVVKKMFARWWRMLLIPALQRQIAEFEASLVYKVSSRTAKATQRNPVSEKKKVLKLYNTMNTDGHTSNEWLV